MIDITPNKRQTAGGASLCFLFKSKWWKRTKNREIKQESSRENKFFFRLYE
jgi:hypothetical protein